MTGRARIRGPCGHRRVWACSKDLRCVQEFGFWDLMLRPWVICAGRRRFTTGETKGTVKTVTERAKIASPLLSTLMPLFSVSRILMPYQTQLSRSSKSCDKSSFNSVYASWKIKAILSLAYSKHCHTTPTVAQNMHAIERCQLTSQWRLALNVLQPDSPERYMVARPEKGFRTSI